MKNNGYGSIEDELLLNVTLGNEGNCVLWQKSVNGGGYGQIQRQRKKPSVHRLSYEMFNGAIPNGQIVRHKCDNPRCVNPYHLELGTTSDNMRDSLKRNRRNAVEGNAPSVERVLKAREMFASGMRQVDICRALNLSDGAVSRIVNRKSWNYI